MSWMRPQFVLLALVVVAACGGRKPSTDLKIRVNESHLAPVPMAERQEIAAAQQAVFLAEWQIKYTEIELSIAKTDVDVAKNEIEKAKLSAKTAETRQTHAQETADQKLIGEAAQLGEVAVLERQVAEQKLAMARQRVDYLEARLEAERLVHRREEARVEQAKAQSMATAGVKPPGFDPKKYKAQYQQREQLAKAAMAKAQQKQKALAGVEQSLAAARAKLNRAQKPAESLPLVDTREKPLPVTPDNPIETSEQPGDAPAEPVEGEPTAGSGASGDTAGKPAGAAGQPPEAPGETGDADPANDDPTDEEPPVSDPDDPPGTGAPGAAPIEAPDEDASQPAKEATP